MLLHYLSGFHISGSWHVVLQVPDCGALAPAGSWAPHNHSLIPSRMGEEGRMCKSEKTHRLRQRQFNKWRKEEEKNQNKCWKGNHSPPPTCRPMSGQSEQWPSQYKGHRWEMDEEAYNIYPTQSGIKGCLSLYGSDDASLHDWQCKEKTMSCSRVSDSRWSWTNSWFINTCDKVTVLLKLALSQIS